MIYRPNLEMLLTSLGKGTKLSFRVAADRVERPPEGGTGTILWDDVFPEASRPPGAGKLHLLRPNEVRKQQVFSTYWYPTYPLLI